MENLPIWLNIDKPINYSSAKVVAIIKKLTKANKVGHCGTLDPLASGILPIALNQATRTSQFIESTTKKYRFEILWGESRDSDDIEGKIIDKNDKRPSNIEIINAIPFFIGKISQTPSKFSAIKIDGKRAYQLARQDIDFTINPREINIYSLKMLDNNQIKASFEVECSKGTYIRSLARDIALKIGVLGCIKSLTRLQVGNFCYKSRISLDKLKIIINYKLDYFNKAIILLDRAMDFIDSITINHQEAVNFSNGQMILINHQSNKHQYSLANKKIVKIINNNKLIGIAEIIDDLNNIKADERDKVIDKIKIIYRKIEASQKLESIIIDESLPSEFNNLAMEFSRQQINHYFCRPIMVFKS
jgi:tRNA pseudouridine55 synthase